MAEIMAGASVLPGYGPMPRTASWLRRVAAVLLDTALIFVVAFMTNGPLTTDLIVPVFSAGPPAGTVGSQLSVLGALLALLILQGLTGATPGKRVLGIMVVGDRTLRPIGLWRTVLRWLSHFVDAILMIGYLRPLWHPERRTFADSICSTLVVLDTRPERSRAVTVVASVVCAVAIVCQLAPTRGRSDEFTMRCESGPNSAEGSFSETVYSRTILGVTRTWTDAHDARITWRSPNDQADQPNFVATFFAADGSEGASVSSNYNDLGSGAAVTVPGSDLRRLGTGWSWTAQWWNSSGMAAQCSAVERS